MMFSELVTKWKLNVDNGEFDKLNGKLEDYRQKLNTLFVVGGTALATSLGAIVKFTADAGKQIDLLAKKVGTSTDSVQELQYAFESLAGINKDQFNDVIQSFAVRLKEAQLGTGEALEGLGVLGLSNSLLDAEGKLRPLEEILFDVADAMKNLQDPYSRIFVSSVLFEGESEAVTNALSQGREGLIKYMREAKNLGFVMSSSAVQQSAAFSKTLHRLEGTLINLRNALAIRLFPVIERIINAFMRWVSQNRKFIDSHLDEFVEGIGDALKAMGSVLKWAFDLWRGFVKMVGGVDNAAATIKGIIAGLAGLSVVLNAISFVKAAQEASVLFKWLRGIGFFAAIISLKFLLIAAAIGLLILVVQDLWSWWQGGDSVMRDVVNAMVDWWNKGLDWIDTKWEGWKKSFFEKWDAFVSFFRQFSFADVFHFLSDKALEIARNAFKKFTDFLFDSVQSFFGDIAGLSLEKVYSVLTDKIFEAIRIGIVDNEGPQIGALTRLDSITPIQAPPISGPIGASSQNFYTTLAPTFQIGNLPSSLSRADAENVLRNRADAYLDSFENWAWRVKTNGNNRIVK